MIRHALLAGATLMVPVAAQAQGLAFDGTVTLGYAMNSFSIDTIDGDLNGFSLDFEGDLIVTEQVSVGMDFNFTSGDLEVDGTPISTNIDLIGLAVEPRFDFGNGGYAGVYYRAGDLDIAIASILSIGVDTSQYGIFGGYDFGQGYVEAFYGMSDVGDNGLIPTGVDVDVTDFGISGAYEVMPQLELFGAYLLTDISSGGDSVDVSAFSIGAEYALGNGIGIYGSYGWAGLDLTGLGAPDDLTANNLAIGASYTISSGSAVPITLSAEYSRTNVDLSVFGAPDDLEIDRFALGLTIPIGGGSSEPLNSNTRIARGEYRSAIAALVNTF